MEMNRGKSVGWKNEVLLTSECAVARGCFKKEPQKHSPIHRYSIGYAVQTVIDLHRHGRVVHAERAAFFVLGNGLDHRPENVGVDLRPVEAANMQEIGPSDLAESLIGLSTKRFRSVPSMSWLRSLQKSPIS